MTMNRRDWLKSYTPHRLAFSWSVVPRPLNTGGGPRANYFPNFVLRTHDNTQVRFYDDLMKSKVVLINMMYAKCEGMCPGVTANLIKVQRDLGSRVGRDIFMYSLTLKPEQDTPAVLHQYATMYGVKPGWLFLTGSKTELDILRRRLGFFDPNPLVDADASQHIGLVRYGSEALDRWAACPALSNPAQIAEAIVEMEAPHQKQTRPSSMPSVR